jgi:hypothetical protein
MRVGMWVWMLMRLQVRRRLPLIDADALRIDWKLTKVDVVSHSLLHHRWTSHSLAALPHLIAHAVLVIGREHVGGAVLDCGETVIPETRHQSIDASTVKLKIRKVEWLLTHLVVASEILHGCHRG